MNLYDVCKKNGIIEEGHFILRSGKHSDVYFRKTLITLHSHLYGEIIRQFCNLITKRFKLQDYELIVGTATAGITFSAPVAVDLGKPSIFSEKVNKNSNEMIFRDEYNKTLFNKRVIIIEDVITTGQSVINVAKKISINGGIPIAIFCILNRDIDKKIITYDYRSDFVQFDLINSGETLIKNFNVPIISLIEKDIRSWNADECPCKKNFRK